MQLHITRFLIKQDETLTILTYIDLKFGQLAICFI